MNKNVNRGDKAAEARAAGRGQTRISSKHQITIPRGAFHRAGLRPGDTLRVAATGAGSLVLTRLDELADRYSGSLDSGGALRAQLEEMRGEWR